jgi:hypothetical protein
MLTEYFQAFIATGQESGKGRIEPYLVVVHVRPGWLVGLVEGNTQYEGLLHTGI